MCTSTSTSSTTNRRWFEGEINRKRRFSLSLSSKKRNAIRSAPKQKRTNERIFPICSDMSHQGQGSSQRPSWTAQKGSSYTLECRARKRRKKNDWRQTYLFPVDVTCRRWWMYGEFRFAFVVLTSQHRLSFKVRRRRKKTLTVSLKCCCLLLLSSLFCSLRNAAKDRRESSTVVVCREVDPFAFRLELRSSSVWRWNAGEQMSSMPTVSSLWIRWISVENESRWSIDSWWRRSLARVSSRATVSKVANYSTCLCRVIEYRIYSQLYLY